jgi:hypothetical protein
MAYEAKRLNGSGRLALYRRNSFALRLLALHNTSSMKARYSLKLMLRRRIRPHRV